MRKLLFVTTYLVLMISSAHAQEDKQPMVTKLGNTTIINSDPSTVIKRGNTTVITSPGDVYQWTLPRNGVSTIYFPNNLNYYNSNTVNNSTGSLTPAPANSGGMYINNQNRVCNAYGCY